MNTNTPIGGEGLGNQCLLLFHSDLQLILFVNFCPCCFWVTASPCCSLDPHQINIPKAHNMWQALLKTMDLGQ